jgi:hypothetical protein
VTASNFVKVDIEGNPVESSEWPTNRAGFVLHSAIHAARADAHCIMHTGSKMRTVVLSALLVLSVVTGCSQPRPVSIAAQPPAPPAAPIQRPLIETPPPAVLPEPPLPAVKPGTELSLAESEALADQASPKAPLETQFTAGQRAIGRAAGQTANPPAASAEAPPLTDVAHLVGLSQTDTTKLFGLPAERRNLPSSEIWTYHSTVCDVKLFFYPEVGKPTFRALTYQIDERGASDATHNACLSSLTKRPAG